MFENANGLVDHFRTNSVTWNYRDFFHVDLVVYEGTQRTGIRVPRNTFSAVDPKSISSAGIDRPRTPITIIGKSRSLAIFRISTKGTPITVIFSTSTFPTSSPSSIDSKLLSA